jgi:SAM-dependent methyltransferase
VRRDICISSAALTADRVLIRFFGPTYLRLTRDRFIHERCRYLVKSMMATGRRGVRFLDVGCGSGMALYYLGRFCGDLIDSYVGIDKDVRRLQKRWDFVSLSHTFHRVDLDDEWNFGEFDFIWCSEVIEHLIDDERLFDRMVSHLARGGQLVLTTPSRPFVERMGRTITGFDGVSLTQDGGHVRTGYEPEDFKCMAARNGAVLASHAWLSCCSTTEARTLFEGGTWNHLRSGVCDVKRSALQLIGSEEPRPSAESCYSLVVSFMKQGAPHVAPTSLPGYASSR